jgi:hypothetical protein
MYLIPNCHKRYQRDDEVTGRRLQHVIQMRPCQPLISTTDSKIDGPHLRVRNNWDNASTRGVWQKGRLVRDWCWQHHDTAFECYDLLDMFHGILSQPNGRSFSCGRSLVMRKFNYWWRCRKEDSGCRRWSKRVIMRHTSCEVPKGSGIYKSSNRNYVRGASFRLRRQRPRRSQEGGAHSNVHRSHWNFFAAPSTLKKNLNV